MTRIVKNPDVRKAEIIKSARQMFQSRDIDKVTMQDVMDDLGIAKGTIYHYFKSKEELLEAVIRDIVDETTVQMQNLVDNSSGNALERLQGLIFMGSIAVENEDLLTQIHRPANAGMHTRLLAAAITRQAPLYAKLFKQGNEEGLFHVEAPLETAEFILSAFQFLTDTGIYPWTEEELARRERVLPLLIETQLKAGPGSFNFLRSGTSDD